MLLANVIFVGVYLCSTIVGCEWLCLECDFSGFCHHRWNFDGINVLIAMHALICTSTNMYGIYFHLLISENKHRTCSVNEMWNLMLMLSEFDVRFNWAKPIQNFTFSLCVYDCETLDSVDEHWAHADVFGAGNSPLPLNSRAFLHRIRFYWRNSHRNRFTVNNSSAVESVLISSQNLLARSIATLWTWQ